MIICNNNSINTIALTLTENLKDYYLIGQTAFTLTIINDTTNEIYSDIHIININEGETLKRYNIFYLELTDKNSVNYNEGRIHLSHNGLYTYIVYLTNGLEKIEVERGILKVKGDNLINTYEYKTTNFNTYAYINSDLINSGQTNPPDPPDEKIPVDPPR